MTGTNAYGTNLARARTGALGHEDGPDGTNARNGSDDGRVHAHVGLASDTNAHGVHTDSHTRVGPRLDGNTDTRGMVDDAERERLQPFGTAVRAMRNAAGLTQEQLGKLAGIGVTHISRLEHGRRRPSVDAIQALARVLAPEGTADAAEQRLARLAGDSLRTGAARRKRQRDNKHRREALRQIERANRTLRSVQGSTGGRDVSSLLAAGQGVADRLRAEVNAEPVGIPGITPRDAPHRRGHRYGRPKSRSLKDIQAWLDAHGVEPDDDDAL